MHACMTTNKIEVIIYYHYSEMGRSPNTAHILPIIAPDLVSKTLIFGDSEDELDFFNNIIQEHQRNIGRTCILYPSYNAIPINQWYQSTRSSSSNLDLPLQVVLLDGTYSHSTKQIKFLQNHFLGNLNQRTLAVGEYFS